MNAYDEANITASVGYEVGTPAYPSPDHDKEHQLPLTKEMFQSILSTTQTKHGAGFIWELYKTPDADDNVDPTTVLQTLCKALMPSSPRCSGTIPPLPSAMARPRVQPQHKHAKKGKKIVA